MTQALNFQEWNADLASEAIQDIKNQPGALIVALHKIQEVFGYLDDAALPLLAKAFNLSRAEVHGVASFYHDFKKTRPGRYTVKICQAEACQAMGSEQLTEDIKSQLGLEFHETDSNGDFSLEPVYCLGNCACSPNIMINDDTYGRVNTERFASIKQALLKEAK